MINYYALRFPLFCNIVWRIYAYIVFCVSTRTHTLTDKHTDILVILSLSRYISLSISSVLLFLHIFKLLHLFVLPPAISFSTCSVFNVFAPHNCTASFSIRGGGGESEGTSWLTRNCFFRHGLPFFSKQFPFRAHGRGAGVVGDDQISPQIATPGKCGGRWGTTGWREGWERKGENPLPPPPKRSNLQIT